MKKFVKSLMVTAFAASLLVTGAVGVNAAEATAAVAKNQNPVAELAKKKFESRLDEIKARGYILVGTTGDYKPFTYLNPETNEFEGYDIDAMKMFAESLGVEARFVQTSWPTLMSDLLDNKFDIAVGGVTRNTARAQQAYLSDGYLLFGKVPLIRAEDKDKYYTIEDLNKPEVRVGVNPGGTNQVFVDTYLTKANVTVVENNLDIPGMVADGIFDVMITDTLEAIVYANADPRLYAQRVDDPFTRNEKAYMIPRGDFIFASYLETWKDEMELQGKFDELYKKWVK